jgi:phosphatidylethanolamine-binding protein (PEBP) family uncharacterized protein
VEFGGGKIVANGNTLSPAETADTPTATIKGGKQGRLYTLVATDPDAPGWPAHSCSCALLLPTGIVHC